MKRRSALACLCAALVGHMLLPLTTFAQDRETWSVHSAWVKELKPEEQRAVILLLEDDFTKHFNTKIAPANQKSVEEALWAIRMFGWSRFFLSELATKNEDMRKFFKDDADRVRTLTVKWSSQKWAEDGAKANRQISEWTRGINSRVGDQVMRDHAKKLKTTSDYLVVQSMGGASLKN
jgi:hypothetical protein